MPVCRRCGSIRTQVIKGTLLERTLALLARQQVLYCGRCGWRGRARLIESGDGKSSGKRRRRRHRPVETAPQNLREPVNDIDLEALDRGLGAEPPKGLNP